MKKIKYILLGILLISLTFSGFPYILEGIVPHARMTSIQEDRQAVAFGFFETYSWNEVLSRVDPGDRFFQVIDTEGVNKDGCRLGSCSGSQANTVWEYVHSDAFQRQLPEDIRFAWGTPDTQDKLSLYALKQPAGNLKGPDRSQIEEVSSVKNDQGYYDLYISFSEKGAERWAQLTGQNVGRSVAVVFDDRVYTAPMVTEIIKNGKCQISGNMDEQDVNLIKSVLEE